MSAQLNSEVARTQPLSKTQIDRIGDRLREGQLDAAAVHALETYRAEFAPAYGRVEQTLRDKLGHAVTGRPAKSTIAIIEKLRRQKTRLTQIQDIAGCRVVVSSVVDQDSLVGAMEVLFADVSVDDKRTEALNGYRAVHVIVKDSNKSVEVQVRTQLQHFWAELSEKMADTYGHEIKYGHGNQWALDLLLRASAQIQRIEDLFRRRLAVNHQMRSRDNALARKAKKQITTIDLHIRLAYYELRGLTKEMGA